MTAAELALLEKAQAGDQDAFEELRAPHRERVRIHATIKVFSSEEQGSVEGLEGLVEELLGRSWLRARERIAEYDPSRANLATWVKHVHFKSEMRDFLREEERTTGLGDLPERGRGVRTAWLIDRLRSFERMLCGGMVAPHPPHKLCCWSLRILLRWMPRQIAEEAGPQTLRALVEQLEDTLTAAIPRPFVTRCLKPLRDAMELRVSRVLKGRSKRLYRDLLQETVGDTRLNQYFSDDGAQSVARWWKEVDDDIE